MQTTQNTIIRIFKAKLCIYTRYMKLCVSRQLTSQLEPMKGLSSTNKNNKLEPMRVTQYIP